MMLQMKYSFCHHLDILRKAGRCTVGKIVYIADYIEPKRDKAPNLAIVRKLAFQDLDECMYKILGDTLAYLEENPKDIDNATKDAFLYYRDLHIKDSPEYKLSRLAEFYI